MNPVIGKTNSRHQQYGLTVLELLIAVAAAAVLLSLAVPSYSSVVHKNRIAAATDLLYLSLNTARSEALKRRDPVRICPSADSTGCRNDGDWSDGWLIFNDANSNNSPDTAEIIQVVDAVEGEIMLQVSSAFSGFIQFQPTGAAFGNGGNTGEFRLCHADAESFSRRIAVSLSGRVAAHDRAQTDCEPG